MTVSQKSKAVRLRKAVAAILLGGVVVIIAGILVVSQNRGMCGPFPDHTNSFWSIACDHTFAGTDIWIGATARLLVISGLVILCSGGGLGVYVRFILPKSVVSKEK